jgi:hypothetical protein
MIAPTYGIEFPKYLFITSDEEDQYPTSALIVKIAARAVYFCGFDNCIPATEAGVRR